MRGDSRKYQREHLGEHYFLFTLPRMKKKVTFLFTHSFSKHKSNNNYELYFSSWTCFSYKNHHETSCGKIWKGRKSHRKRLRERNKTTDFQLKDKVKIEGWKAELSWGSFMTFSTLQHLHSAYPLRILISGMGKKIKV